MKLRVECSDGFHGKETPRYIFLGQRRVVVCEVIDCWPASDHRYFKIRGDDEAVYIIRHEIMHQTWELVFFNRTDSSPIDSLSTLQREIHVHYEISEASGKIRNPIIQ